MNPGKEPSCEDCPYPKGYPCILCEYWEELLPDSLLDQEKGEL